MQVTGGNKGIGYAIVKGLCEKFDGKVYLTARDEGRGKAAVENLKELGFHPEFHQLDTTNDDSIATFANYIRDTDGGIDVLVNNAGMAFKVVALDYFLTRQINIYIFRRMLQIHLKYKQKLP